MVFLSSQLLYLILLQSFSDSLGFSILSSVIWLVLIDIPSFGQRLPWTPLSWTIPEALLGVLVPFPLGGERPVAYCLSRAQVGIVAQPIDPTELEDKEKARAHRTQVLSFTTPPSPPGLKSSKTGSCCESPLRILMSKPNTYVAKLASSTPRLT